MGVALVALVASVVLIAVVLTRQRERHRPEVEPDEEQPQRRKLTRQEKILAKLDPLPEIPTLMDLVRIEISEEGVDEIPGHEDLPDPVKLKVFRRDQRIVENCTHDAFAFVVAEGVERKDATEVDVSLHCEQCGDLPPVPDDPGTDATEETLPE